MAKSPLGGVNTLKRKGSGTNAIRRHYAVASRKGRTAPGRIGARGK